MLTKLTSVQLFRQFKPRWLVEILLKVLCFDETPTRYKDSFKFSCLFRYKNHFFQFDL